MELVINPPQEVFVQHVNLTSSSHGWAHQFYDYKFYSEAYDGFWLVTMLDKSKGPTENLVSAACLGRWNDKNGKPLYGIGMFYCKEEYRGKGYGKPVFQKMMDIVGEDNCVLTAAPAMSQKYADVFGFSKMLPYWQLKAEIQPETLLKTSKLSAEYTTKNWKDVDPDELDAYTSTVCNMERKKILRLWFQQEGVYTRVAFDSAHKIVGHCSIRTVKLNRLCGAPFYAENEEVAARLLADVIKEIPDFEKFEKLIFWYPEINKNMENLLSRFFPKEAFHIKVDFRVQFTKEMVPSRDEVVYSVSCRTIQFV